MSTWKRTGNVACTPATSREEAVPNDTTSGEKDGQTRARGWGSRPPAGYVTIGSIRYGVRYASSIPPPVTQVSRTTAPPITTANNHRSSTTDAAADCCCGVVQLSWPRASPPPSRLPLPSSPSSTVGEKPRPIIRNSMFSRLNASEQPSRVVSRGPAVKHSGGHQQQVYKSTLEWCAKKSSTGKSGGVRSCFSGEDDEDTDDGRLKMIKERVVPPSPLRRHILVRSKPELPSYLKVNYADREALLKQELLPADNNNMDRLNRFRFGAERKESVGRGKKKRSTDKTERLKELTEKLKSPSASSSPDRDVGQTKLPKYRPPNQQEDGQAACGVTTKFGRQPTHPTALRNMKYQQNLKHDASLTEEPRKLIKQRSVGSPTFSSPDRSNYQQRIEENLRFQQELEQEELQSLEYAGLTVKPGPVPCGSNTMDVGAAVTSPPSNTPITEEESSDDLFFLHRPESRTIVGSYTQSKIPYRSASFSQVDYSSVDGKYIRNHGRTSPYGGYTPTASGSHTLPRKRLPDIQSSNSVSPSSSTTISGLEPIGSEEGLIAVSVSKLVEAFSGEGKGLINRGELDEGDEGFVESFLFATAAPVRGVLEEESGEIEREAPCAVSSGEMSGEKDVVEDRTEPSPPVCSDVTPLSAEESSEDRTETAEDLSSPWLYALEHNNPLGNPALGLKSGNYESAEIAKQKQYPVIAKSIVVFQADVVEQEVFCDKADKENRLDDEVAKGDDGMTDTSKGTFITQWPKEYEEPTVSSLQEETSAQIEEVFKDVSKEVEDEVQVLSKQHDDVSKHGPKARREDEIDYSKECVRQCEEWLKELGEDFQSSQHVTDRADENVHTTDVEEEELNCLKAELKRSEPLTIERVESEKLPQVANEVAIITTPPQWVDDGSIKRWSGEGTDSDRNDWGSPTEEPQTPEELGVRPQWPSPRRWPLVYQSSDEREDETPNLSRPSPRRYLTVRTDSFSEGESETGDTRPRTPTREERDRASPSLLSPSEEFDGRSGRIGPVHEARSIHIPRRYSKRPLRGPYGQMLEAEMKKPETSRIFSKHNYNDDLKVFLEEYRPNSPPIVTTPETVRPTAMTPEMLRPTSDPKAAPRRSLATHSLDDSQLKGGYGRSASVSNPTPSARRTSPKRKVNANLPFPVLEPEEPGGGLLTVRHQRTTSSPSTLDGYSSNQGRGDRGRPEPTPELLAELLRGSSERLSTSTSAINGNSVQDRDTRTHVVVELYDTERNYVEALQILVMKYLQPLKSPENAGLVDASLVDEIFYQVPAILQHHELLLDELRKRLDNWDVNQKIGDVFLDAFTRQPVIETYTSFINNWKSAKEAIKTTCQAKPAFARFIEAMAREHKGKLALDCLLIKPVQRIPRYELLIQRLLKHTETSHPDHALLLEAQKEVHELAVKINCTERESLEYEQQQNTLKELENIIEGSINLVSNERTFVRHDTVTMASGQGTRKERALFLFSDLLVITSIKRRSGTIRKPSATCPGSVTSTLEANKYKLLMRVPLDDLEIVKSKDENLKKRLREMENLSEDIALLNQVSEMTSALHCPHGQLEEVVRDMLSAASKQLEDQRTTDAQLSYLELALNTQSGTDNISVIFTKAEKRNWEESFNEAKQKLALSADRRVSPEFLLSVPIRKTRAGLQFTCASPTLGLNASNLRDVWVCNSDGYVGQVCVLSLQPEPNVVSCNGVCNARILCVASIPAGITGPSAPGSLGQQPFASTKIGISISVEDTDKSGSNIQLDSSSSSSDEDDQEDERPTAIAPPEDEMKRARSASDSVLNSEREPPVVAPTDDTDNLQPTMWLGTEDGCIHVYNCSDNIRIKKNKVKIQHGSAVYCIIYLDNRVFVALANGDITVYIRDHSGWNTSDPYTVSVGTASTPVTRMLPVAGKLWCGCHNAIKILNTFTLEVEHSFIVNADLTRNVTWLATAGLGAWISLHNSAIVRLFHATTYECLTEVNVAPAVNKMLASCDDIIRQHKAACLRVTSLLACKDLLWIGTSAGVVLTMALPHISPSTTKLATAPTATGVPHGHTGHVRFLTVVETLPTPATEGLVVRPSTHHRYSLKSKPEMTTTTKLLVISGGDGYEDFRTSSASEVAGREDSTNHLLVWHV